MHTCAVLVRTWAFRSGTRLIARGSSVRDQTLLSYSLRGNKRESGLLNRAGYGSNADQFWPEPMLDGKRPQNEVCVQGKLESVAEEPMGGTFRQNSACPSTYAIGIPFPPCAGPPNSCKVYS